MFNRQLAAILLAAACSAGAAQAATQTVSLMTTSEANAIYLFADNAGTRLAAPRFLNAPMSDWRAFANTGTELFLAGSTVLPGLPHRGRYAVEVSYEEEIAFQWAEVLWDAGTPDIKRALRLTWRADRGWRLSGEFTRGGEILDPALSAVPLPSSVLLLGSALLGLMAVGRRGRAERLADPARPPPAARRLPAASLGTAA